MQSPGWQVLDFSGFKGKLKYTRGKLLVQPGDGRADQTVALSQIAVVLIGMGVYLSGAVLSKLSEYDVAVLVCDWRGVPVAGASPWASHTRIAARQIAQADLSLPRRKQAWAALVRAKISGQARTLDLLGYPRQSKILGEMARKVRSGDTDNREAMAARIYWSALLSETPEGRMPGAGFTGWNCTLDYAYTILRGHGIRAVSSAGLVGTLGVFHKSRSNEFCLVDDLIEPFRPAVDYAVFSLAPESPEELTSELKQALVAACESTFEGGGRTIPTSLMQLSQRYGRYVEGELASFAVQAWEGPFDAEEGE